MNTMSHARMFIFFCKKLLAKKKLRGLSDRMCFCRSTLPMDPGAKLSAPFCHGRRDCISEWITIYAMVPKYRSDLLSRFEDVVENVYFTEVKPIAD